MNETTNNRIYLELFIVNDGKRVNIKTIDLVDVSSILTNKVVEGLEEIIKIPPIGSEVEK